MVRATQFRYDFPMSEPTPSLEYDPDVTFITNMKSYREAQKIGRTEFARQMTNLGYPWHESVIPKVEKGDRKVPIGEAVAISKILGLTVEEMTKPSANAEQVARLVAELREYRQARKGLEQAAADVDHLRMIAKRRYEHIRAESPESLTSVELAYKEEIWMLADFRSMRDRRTDVPAKK